MCLNKFLFIYFFWVMRQDQTEAFKMSQHTFRCHERIKFSYDSAGRKSHISV